GHAIAAQAHGCRVHEITLMFFGGKATMSGLPSAPLRRAAISIAGPAAGLLLWLAAAGAATLAADAGLSWLSFTLAETARMSRFLSLFNMIPALPLDGGHVLRDVIAHFRGRALASYATARLSKWIAWAMGLYGLLGWDFLLVFLAFYVWRAACDELALAASGGDDPDGLDDDVVVISPPPFGKEREYTRIRRR
ncbi:MAG: site-2 protease family protein, partial [Kiritimatiellae bacterium]|nr:site-2 protease family protein [Kiritimatiellia bacterium]